MTRPDVVTQLLAANALEDLGEAARAAEVRAELEQQDPPTELEHAEASRVWRDDAHNLQANIRESVRASLASAYSKPSLRLVIDREDGDRV